MLRKWSRNCKKALQPMNDFQGLSKSLVLVPFDMLYMIYYKSSIVSISLSCTVFEKLTLIGKNFKMSHHPLGGQSVISGLVLYLVNRHGKCEFSSFSRPRDISGGIEFVNGLRDTDHVPLKVGLLPAIWDLL